MKNKAQSHPDPARFGAGPVQHREQDQADLQCQQSRYYTLALMNIHIQMTVALTDRKHLH